MKNGILIETNDFIGGQLNYTSVPQVVEAIAPHAGVNGVTVSYTRNGEVNAIFDVASGAELLHVGEFFTATEDGYQRHTTPKEVVEHFETLHEMVEGADWEEKVKNILYTRFVGKYIAGEYDDVPTPEDDWARVEFPYAADEETLLQRARYGFGDKDWYNFNDYLATIIIAGLTRFRDHGMGVPLNDAMIEAYNTEKHDAETIETATLSAENEWNDKLQVIIDGMNAYLHRDEDDVDDDEVVMKLGKALHVFSEVFVDLWD